jgi:hypothetical protein
MGFPLLFNYLDWGENANTVYYLRKYQFIILLFVELTAGNLSRSNTTRMASPF